MGCGGRQRLLFAVMNLVAGYICDVAGYNCDVKCNISVVGVGGSCSAGSDNGWISNAVAVIYSEGNSSCVFLLLLLLQEKSCCSRFLMLVVVVMNVAKLCVANLVAMAVILMVKLSLVCSHWRQYPLISVHGKVCKR